MTLHMDYPFSAELETFDEFADLWVESDDIEWVWSNVITTDDGQMVGSSGTSADLTGGYDRRILHVLRSCADIVLLGAQTVRSEPFSIPRDIPVAIVSRSSVPPEGAVERADAGLILVTTDRIDSSNGEYEVVQIPLLSGDDIIHALRELGYRRILCEGGADILSTLLASNLIDRWYQTIAPDVSGDSGVACPIPESGAPLLEAHDDDGFVYGAVHIRNAHLVTVYDS